MLSLPWSPTLASFGDIFGNWLLCYETKLHFKTSSFSLDMSQLCMSIAYLFNVFIALETLFQNISKTRHNLFKLCHDRGNQGRYIQAPLSDFWKHSMGGVKLSFFIVQIGGSSHFNDFYRGFLLVYLEFSRFRRQIKLNFKILPSESQPIRDRPRLPTVVATPTLLNCCIWVAT